MFQKKLAIFILLLNSFILLTPATLAADNSNVSNYFNPDFVSTDTVPMDTRDSMSLPFLANNSLESEMHSAATTDTSYTAPVVNQVVIKRPAASNYVAPVVTINNDQEEMLSEMMKVVAYALNIRSTAKMARNIIGHLHKDDLVSVIAHSNNNFWCNVETAGHKIKGNAEKAWVACRYLVQ